VPICIYHLLRVWKFSSFDDFLRIFFSPAFCLNFCRRFNEVKLSVNRIFSHLAVIKAMSIMASRRQKNTGVNRLCNIAPHSMRFANTPQKPMRTSQHIHPLMSITSPVIFRCGELCFFYILIQQMSITSPVIFQSYGT
jgi:hypothetical protein